MNKGVLFQVGYDGIVWDVYGISSDGFSPYFVVYNVKKERFDTLSVRRCFRV